MALLKMYRGARHGDASRNFEFMNSILGGIFLFISDYMWVYFPENDAAFKGEGDMILCRERVGF